MPCWREFCAPSDPFGAPPQALVYYHFILATLFLLAIFWRPWSDFSTPLRLFLSVAKVEFWRPPHPQNGALLHSVVYRAYHFATEISTHIIS